LLCFAGVNGATLTHGYQQTEPASDVQQASETGCVSLDDCVTRAQKRLDDFRLSTGCPGATLGFVLPGGRSAAVATGVSHKASGRPMQPSDRMFSGSIGKTYVAALLLQLLEERLVELDAKISHWFREDEWFSRLPNASDITLRMLLNHTTGIPRHIMTPGMKAAVKASPQKVWKPEELLGFVFGVEPLFPAGEGWAYADTNYILVGMIIERVTGKTYYQELTDRILRPQQLTDTSPADRSKLRGLVSGYTSERNLFSLPAEVASDGTYAINPQLEWTGGGLITTSLDLARWAHRLYGGQVVKANTFQLMKEGIQMGGDPDQKYGLGVMMRSSEEGPVLGHAGWVPGYVSMMAYYPQHKVAVAIQVNSDQGVGKTALQTILDDLAGELKQACKE
jgi:D-alanyl-D-alanine carboxypeptidase